MVQSVSRRLDTTPLQALRSAASHIRVVACVFGVVRPHGCGFILTRRCVCLCVMLRVLHVCLRVCVCVVRCASSVL